MERLTGKEQLTASVLYKMEIDCELETVAKCYNKLGQLEDIEEELGIDLITLFKALKNGFYIKDKKNRNKIYKLEPDEINISLRSLLGQISIIIQELYFEDLDCVMDTTGDMYYSEDYGKTWSLVREELEK